MFHIDPNRKYIEHRLYRESCMKMGETYIKDLNILGRDLKKTLIIDNNLHSFAYQVFKYINKISRLRMVF